MTIGEIEKIEDDEKSEQAFESFKSLFENNLTNSDDWMWRECLAVGYAKAMAKKNHLDFVDVSKDKLAYDCIYGKQKVDVKAESKLPFQMSLGFETKEGKYMLPGYLRESDVDLWMMTIGIGEPIYEMYLPNWQIRIISKNPKTFGTIYMKDPKHDYFGRKHKMLILDKHLIQCQNKFKIANDVMYSQ